MSNPTKSYHGSTVYKPKWNTPYDVKNFISELTRGETLNVCSGRSPLGDVKVDVDGDLTPDVRADLHNLPFADCSFSTVYVDPPFAKYDYPNGYWPREVWRVTDRRLILESPGKRVTLPHSTKQWYILEPNPGSSQQAVRHIQVFDRQATRLSDFTPHPHAGEGSQ